MNLLFLAFWNNGKSHRKFSLIFLTKNVFLKNNVKSLPKIYLFLPKINVWKPPPPPPQIRAEHFQTCMLIYRQFLTRENLLFLAFWNNGKLHTKFSPIFLTKNLLYFSYQKIAFQKQSKITTKNLPYFSYQKINVWKGGPPTKSGQKFCFKF